ncbi:FISUMP domain-containing protein [Flavobacterium sp.]|uniref:FISUMP domain-containing protein n=1 Tax=Flavobacterium sp. TaxID=239 RepID=UPI0033412DD2
MNKLIWFFLCLVFHSYSQTPGNGVTDIDGNNYNSVIIGTQEWMKENLNVSKYSDGTPIPQVTSSGQWANVTTGAWCYYNNDPANGIVYGKIYNWYAVAGIYDAASAANPSLRKQLAPTGWHVPTNIELLELSNYLGGGSLAGGKLKESGLTHWTSPNLGANNESGFTGIPGAGRNLVGDYYYSIGERGEWWCSTENTNNPLGASEYYLHHNYGSLYIASAGKKNGLSVRCLNNNLLSNTTLETNRINLYPNPVINILNIKTNENLINQTFTIIDSLGRVVLNGKLNEVECTINVEQLDKGIYYLKISTVNAAKFIKD